jgi:hypothetical protein
VGGSGTQLLEALDEAEVGGVKERELLLDSNREVGRVLESRAGGVEVEGAQVR